MSANLVNRIWAVAALVKNDETRATLIEAAEEIVWLKKSWDSSFRQAMGNGEQVQRLRSALSRLDGIYRAEQDEPGARPKWLEDALAGLPVETSPSQGLRSISIEPRGALMAVVICFDSIEDAQRARPCITNSLIGTGSAAKTSAPCDHMFSGPAGFEDALCVKGCGMRWSDLNGRAERG